MTCEGVFVSKKRFKSKNVLTGGTALLASTVLSCSSFASADWNFSLGKDDTKGVYYIGSGSQRKEYTNMWDFIKALISKIFGFIEKEKVQNKSNSVDDKSVKLEQQQQDAKNRYETVVNLLEEMTDKSSLEAKSELNDGSYLYRFETGNILKNNTEVHSNYFIFNVAEVKISKDQMIVDYNVSGLNKKIFINFEEENSLEKAIDVLENIKIHHNIVRNQIQEKLFNEEKREKNNLIFTFDEKEGIKISPRGGKVIKVKNGDYIEKIVLSNNYCSVKVHYANKVAKEYDLTNLDAARKLKEILENVDVKDNEANIKNYNVCAEVKEQIIALRRKGSFDDFTDPIWVEVHHLGLNRLSEEQAENFIRKSGKSLTFKFCTSDLYKSYKKNMAVDFHLANVTINPEKLVVDYKISGLDKVIVVDFKDDDALEKASTALKQIKAHQEVLKYLFNDLYYRGLVRFYKKGADKKVIFSADDGCNWKILHSEITIKDAVLDNYSTLTLNYTDGKKVSYNLTKLKDANELMKILKSSYFQSLKEQEYEFDPQGYENDIKNRVDE